MSSNGEGNLDATGDRPNTDPMLGPLQDNGGPTPTHALLPESPAIDAGRNDLALDESGRQLELDQRGRAFPRVTDDGVNIGAFEAGTPRLLSFQRQTPAAQRTTADTLVFQATFDEDVTDVSAADFVVTGTTASVENVEPLDARTYLIVLAGGDLENFNGTVGLNLSVDRDISDSTGNLVAFEEPPIEETYTVDNTGPALSVVRQNPGSQITAADTLVFRATFDEDVTGADASDFLVSGGSTAGITTFTTVDARTYELTVSGGTTATITSVSPPRRFIERTEFDITVSGGDLASYNGIVGLDVSGTSDIVDEFGNTIVLAEPAIDETYTVDNIAPQVESIIVDDGSAQRSSVRSITVNFDSAVVFDAGAFERKDDQNNSVDVTTSVAPGTLTNQVVLTFTGTGSQFGSLVDGSYTLTVLSAKVRDASGLLLDGDKDGSSGGDAVDDFYRLYGDMNGDGTTNFTDFASFLLPSFGSADGDADYRAGLDYNNDGRVNFADFASGFLPNFGKTR